jgi:hypothetical protein
VDWFNSYEWPYAISNYPDIIPVIEFVAYFHIAC